METKLVEHQQLSTTPAVLASQLVGAPHQTLTALESLV